MPSIPQYYSQSEPLSPSAAGASAWEQAGRRIGPLFNEAATFRQRQGRLAADAEKQKLWPFDILRLYQIDATEQAKAAAPSGGSGFKVNSRPGATGNASDFDVPRYLNDGWTPGFNDLGQVSRGAAAIGNAVSDGGYGLAKSPKAGGAPAPDAAGGGGGGDFMLYQGQFVSSAYGQKLDAESRADATKQLNQYGTNLADYYSQYYGYQPNESSQPGSTNPNTGAVNDRPAPNMYQPPSAPVPSYEQSTGGFFGLPSSNTGTTPDQWGVY